MTWTTSQIVWLVLVTGIFNFLVTIGLHFRTLMHISRVYTDMLALAKTLTLVAKATNDALDSEHQASNEQEPS